MSLNHFLQQIAPAVQTVGTVALTGLAGKAFAVLHRYDRRQHTLPQILEAAAAQAAEAAIAKAVTPPAIQVNVPPPTVVQTAGPMTPTAPVTVNAPTPDPAPVPNRTPRF